MSLRESSVQELKKETPQKNASKKTLNVVPIIVQPVAEKAPESAESGVIQLVPLGIQDKEFVKFFDEYFAKIDYNQRSSFGDAETCLK
jgi:hypothetical protein